MEPEILVVDDDNAIRETLRFVLEDEGYRVVEAGDGPTALRILRDALRPLVVLLDQCMPTLDGAGVLRAVTADPATAGRHSFILLTASPTALQDAEREFGHQLAAIIAKPFDVEPLLDTVAQVLQRTRSAAVLPLPGAAELPQPDWAN